MMWYRALIVTFVVSMLAACATPTASIDKSYSLSKQSNRGLLVGSIKYSGPLSGYKVYFNGIDNGQSGYFEAGKGMMLIPIPPKSDFSNIKGKLQVVDLPAGEYEISSWGVQSGYANLSQTQPFSIKFKIEPGKATYIGSFIFSVTDRLGLTVTGVRVDFSEQYSDDVAVLREKYPNLGDTEIYLGLEPKFTKKDVGGKSSTRWNMPLIFIPGGG